MHFYSIYGLWLRSDIELVGPEQAAGESWDVEIMLGAVPGSIGDAQVGIRYQLARDVAVFTVDGVARYLVENGRRIVVEPAPKADGDAVRLFCLETALPTLLAQREELVLRGSAIVVNGVAWAFLGESGAGKSTIAAGMVLKGHDLLTDGICLTRPGQNRAWLIESGPPELRLWPSDLKRLGVDPASLPRVRRRLEKRRLQVRGHDRSVPVRHICFVQSSFDESFRIEPIDSATAYGVFQSTRMGASILSSEYGGSLYLQLCMMLVQSVTFSRLTRPRRRALIAPMIESIENHFRS